MSDPNEPHLTAEREREHEAAAAGIECRAVLLDVDTDDTALEDGPEADLDDDEAVEDDDETPVATGA
jgi:hypothetical protein